MGDTGFVDKTLGSGQAWWMRGSLIVSVVLLGASGCWKPVDGTLDPVVTPVWADFAVPDSATALPILPVVTDAGSFFGSETAPPNFALLPVGRVAAGQAVTIPFGASAFAVTADGVGGYRVAWVDGAHIMKRVHGSIYTAGSFTQVTAAGTVYALTSAPNRVDFEGQPGTIEGQVDLVSSTDPIWIDVLVGSSRTRVPIQYIDSVSLATVSAAQNPSGFTSP